MYLFLIAICLFCIFHLHRTQTSQSAWLSEQQGKLSDFQKDLNMFNGEVLSFETNKDTLFALNRVTESNIQILLDRLKKLEKDRKPVVIISAYDRPNPADFGFDENEPAFSIHRGWPSPGAEETYLNAVKEFEAGWPSRMVTANNKLPERPIPSDFGFVERESGMDGEGGWTLEGGEEAYFDALKKYELATSGRVIPKHL